MKLVVEHAAYIGCKTNNIAELMGFEMTLDWLAAHAPGATLAIVTDSQYCQGVLTQDPSKGPGQWMFKAKANTALIERIRRKIVGHTRTVREMTFGQIAIRHVRGHQGDKYNERADDLAVWCKLHQKNWYRDYPFGQPFPAFPPAEGAHP